MKAVNHLPGTDHLIISCIEEDSIAKEVGLESGDALLGINDKIIEDIIDYYSECTTDTLELEIRKKNGETWQVSIDKDVDEDIGIRFISDIPGKIYRCQNKCIFCFVDQLPKGLRSSLYIKDDDFRHSFLYGNYISLTNLNSADWERIVDLHLSPLYVSVHTTNPRLRSKMMGNAGAAHIMGHLRKLIKAGIRIHGQVVVCPGINDRSQLERTLRDLSLLWPSFLSVSVVPVGVTKFQMYNPAFSPVDGNSAGEIIDLVERLQGEYMQTLGTNFVFPADELFLKAERELPVAEYYEDFPQLENGVGSVRIFLDDFRELLPQLPRRLDEEREVVVVTGTAMGSLLADLLKELNEEISGLNAAVLPVENKFFGSAVNVAGLLAGRDVTDALIAYRIENPKQVPKAVLSSVMLKPGEDIFLDEMTPGDVEREAETKITIVENDARGLLTGVLNREVEK